MLGVAFLLPPIASTVKITVWKPSWGCHKATVEIRQFCRAFVHDPKYLEGATRRVIAGKSP